MPELRNIAALNGTLKRIFFVTGAGVIYSFTSLASAHADGEVTSPETTSSETQTQTTTVETVAQTVETAASTLTSTVSTATEYQVSQNTAVITDAQTAVTNAQTAVEIATTAASNVITAETAVTTATTELATAQSDLQTATTAVTTQEAVVTQETNELTAIQNTPVGSMVYTTAGYVAPVEPETPTVTTTTLPQMGDASVQIQTPFDIKMGDTVFNGQGSDSQIYVSSKAIISFGGPDYTFWDYPNMTQDGIYVFQSDYMTYGQGAGITVTTTETTLKVDWNVHLWGDYNGSIKSITWDMTVNPETGEWTGVGTVTGNPNAYGGPRTAVRQDNVLTVIPTYTEAQKTTAVQTQQGVVTQETNELTTLQGEKQTAEGTVQTKESAVETATSNLTTAQNVASVTLATAQSLATVAVEKVMTAVTAVSSTPTQAPAPQPTAPEPQPSPQPKPKPEPVTPPSEVPTESPQDSNTDSSSEEQQNQDNQSSQEDTTDVTPSNDEETPSDDSQSSTDTQNDSSNEDSNTQPQPDTSEQSQDTADQPTDSQADDSTDSNQTQPVEQLPSETQSSNPPTSPDSLPETTPLLPPASALVPRIQVDQAGVTNGGIQFYGTKSQPQVIGEDGKLTPPPPPPGSGLPIPPDAITTADTFIGQPGGTTFNAPDIAVPVEVTYVCKTLAKEDGTQIHVDLDGNEHSIEQCTFLPAALDAIPGVGEAVQAMSEAFAALANIGNDMSPITRKKAKKVLVATIIGGVVFRRRFGE